jgi:uncharacterized protein (DUF1330 family)
MPAYIIASGHVTDPAAYDIYRQQVPALVARHGGRFLVRGGAAVRLEGEGDPGRQVVLEFPDMAHARAFHSDPDYAPLIALRQRASTLTLIAVEGVPLS